MKLQPASHLKCSLSLAIALFAAYGVHAQGMHVESRPYPTVTNERLEHPEAGDWLMPTGATSMTGAALRLASTPSRNTGPRSTGFLRRRSARVHITKALSSLADSSTVRRRFFQRIARDLGEHDATPRVESTRGKTKEQRSHERKTPQCGQRRRTEPICTAAARLSSR